MAKKRTKKQKMRATYHYAFPASRSFSGVETKSSESTQTAKSRTLPAKVDTLALYDYDPLYIRQDLAKTFILTVLMILLEIALYIALH